MADNEKIVAAAAEEETVEAPEAASEDAGEAAGGE